MAFTQLTPMQYPRRQWSLVGYPGSGKSTFAAQMGGPLVVVDSDHRFGEVVSGACGEVYELSANPADNVDAQCIVRLLKANMPGSDVKTIVVDSLTAIIAPLVTHAVMSNDAGDNKNRVASFKSKAMALRLLQDGITGWGTDTLWVYHLRQGLDGQAREVESFSITPVELARLRRSLNMQLRLVHEGNKRGVTVDWARQGRYPLTLWDDSGGWVEMPERIEEAVYGGLAPCEMNARENTLPTGFSSSADAIAWGWEQGCFKDAVHARNAYNTLKQDRQPATAAAMWAMWIEDVQLRMAGQDGPTHEECNPSQAALIVAGQS